MIRAANVPVIAVSPIIAGQSIKGPLAKMMQEMGMPADVRSIAAHYRGLIDILVVDEQDSSAQLEGIDIRTARTLMNTLEDRVALAVTTLEMARGFRRATP